MGSRPLPCPGSNHARAFFLATGLGGFLDAHRAFIISDSRFRSAAVIPARFFAARLVAVVFSAALFAAHRLLVASIIRLRPSGVFYSCV